MTEILDDGKKAKLNPLDGALGDAEAERTAKDGEVKHDPLLDEASLSVTSIPAFIDDVYWQRRAESAREMTRSWDNQVQRRVDSEIREFDSDITLADNLRADLAKERLSTTVRYVPNRIVIAALDDRPSLVWTEKENRQYKQIKAAVLMLKVSDARREANAWGSHGNWNYSGNPYIYDIHGSRGSVWGCEQPGGIFYKGNQYNPYRLPTFQRSIQPYSFLPYGSTPSDSWKKWDDSKQNK